MQSDESFDDLHERALAVLGHFAGLQALMDHMVDVYLRTQLPELGAAVIDVALRRRRDEDRLALIRALAREADYSGIKAFDADFSRVFNRCKQMRDLVGHSAGIVGPVYGVGTPPHVGVARYQGTKTNLLPDVLLPSHFDRFSDQITWLSDHVIRIGHESGASIANLVGEPVEPPLPGPLPHPDM